MKRKKKKTFYFSIFVVVVYVQSQRICQYILANHISRPRTPDVDGWFTVVKELEFRASCSDRQGRVLTSVWELKEEAITPPSLCRQEPARPFTWQRTQPKIQHLILLFTSACMLSLLAPPVDWQRAHVVVWTLRCAYKAGTFLFNYTHTWLWNSSVYLMHNEIYFRVKAKKAAPPTALSFPIQTPNPTTVVLEAR